MFRGKKVLLGVCGGIAAYKACDLARLLIKDGMEIHVIMTDAAQKFVTPLTFKALTGNEVGLDMFSSPSAIGHITAARAVDVIVVAPATANTLARITGGFADDLLATTILAARVPVVLAPAMNVAMWENPATQANVWALKERGFSIVGPDRGEMACGEYGEGKLSDVEEIAEAVRRTLAAPKNLARKKFVVTSGPTRERLDPVRYISNRSSGKMGVAIARALVMRGAEVTFICGVSEVKPPFEVKVVPVESAQQMRDAAVAAWDGADGAILVAAVADYRPDHVAERKIKKTDQPVDVRLERTTDILAELGASKGDRFLVGFAAETDDLFINAIRKLEGKNLDMIVANDVTVKGVGFGSDRNSVVIIRKKGEPIEILNADKNAIAWKITGTVAEMING
ncbi:MAG: bifunctional phosphopantothenoylcysteine decarboxylase/phosphopantothenate--cysteine ligase CoaBC [Myxococcota bacterium]|jgi:phosphopantothenoylcysteine decarboxylase/phosphopantothenate--cysteine ligase